MSPPQRLSWPNLTSQLYWEVILPQNPYSFFGETQGIYHWDALWSSKDNISLSILLCFLFLLTVHFSLKLRPWWLSQFWIQTLWVQHGPTEQVPCKSHQGEIGSARAILMLITWQICRRDILFTIKWHVLHRSYQSSWNVWQRLRCSNSARSTW